jgi:hypothetical protein
MAAPMRFAFFFFAFIGLPGCIASTEGGSEPPSDDGGSDASSHSRAASADGGSDANVLFTGPILCGYLTCDAETQYCRIIGGCPMYEPGCDAGTFYECVSLTDLGANCQSQPTCACVLMQDQNRQACGCDNDGGLTVSCSRY